MGHRSLRAGELLKDNVQTSGGGHWPWSATRLLYREGWAIARNFWLMEVAFDYESLRSICEDQAVAKNKLGPAVAETLRHRLADLRAANAVSDLPAGNPRNSVLDNDECLFIDLCDGYVIALRANHRSNPTNEGGELDWGRVSRLRMVRIGCDDG